ncbi:hypothetical protein QN277_024909 [Acacia crassicarpa]|uniref:Replication factor A C-terminal domain-containing protein n=1 Tax=Acacia crassicarpa TaxID=499986 RepID=A0AAE1MNN5_9FABA|nr:hypothetical protein QN277_024909 [Acacia crassicarpa]
MGGFMMATQSSHQSLSLKMRKIQNSPLLCPGCKRAPDSVAPKMKLHCMVKDDSGSASVLFWDKHAVELLNRNALQLKLSLPGVNKTHFHS